VTELSFGRRYRVIERIGSGGMAEVFKAVDEVLGRTVAVKVLHPRFATEANFVARFRQEAQAAANLSHPNIVNIYDWGRDGDTYYIVMEYVKGTDLKTMVDDDGPVDPVRAAEYGAQVCAALAVAHGYDVIHRDIKPHNIVITPDGTVKVMDFGIARAGNTTMTQTGSVLGTAQYISPEQAQGGILGPSSDLYSLGATLYELVTGQVPFDADTPVAIALKQVNEHPVPPRQIRSAVPVALEAVIMKAMRKNPTERYSSANEMREELLQVVRGDKPPVVAPSAPDYVDNTTVMPAVERAERLRSVQAPQVQPIPERRGNPWPWIALVAAVVLIGVGIAWALGVFGPGSVAVPSVVGMSEQEASSTIAAQGLRVGEVTPGNSSEYAEGEVMEQNPPAGTRVEGGTTVNLVVSAGVEQVKVPNIAGMTEAEAILELEKVGLDVALPVTREFSPEVAEGLVISSDPPVDSMVAKAGKVVLVVSKGTQLVKVPDVVNQKRADAEKTLADAQFKSTSTEAFSDTVASGSVVSQRPEAGVSVDAGSTIALVISKGPAPVTVLDVTNMTEEDATDDLERIGLKVTVTYVDSMEDGIVINQNPLPDAQVAKGTTVTLTVGKTP
jgi:serine/threonine-protein kinase